MAGREDRSPSRGQRDARARHMHRRARCSGTHPGLADCPRPGARCAPVLPAGTPGVESTVDHGSASASARKTQRGGTTSWSWRLTSGPSNRPSWPNPSPGSLASNKAGRTAPWTAANRSVIPCMADFGRVGKPNARRLDWHEADSPTRREPRGERPGLPRRSVAIRCPRLRYLASLLLLRRCSAHGARGRGRKGFLGSFVRAAERGLPLCRCPSLSFN